MLASILNGKAYRLAEGVPEWALLYVVRNNNPDDESGKLGSCFTEQHVAEDVCRTSLDGISYLYDEDLYRIDVVDGRQADQVVSMLAHEGKQRALKCVEIIAARALQQLKLA